MRRLLVISVVAALLGALASPAAARLAPPGFIGISPQNTDSNADFELMELAGIRSTRLPMAWAGIEREPSDRHDPHWAWFDGEVERAAEHGIRIFPFVWESPEWVAPLPTAEPVESPWQREAWLEFLRRAEERYGPQGEFWDEHPDLPALPIRRWEIWNEENIVTFSHRPSAERFAKLIRISGDLLHRLDPGSKVLIGGLFGRPLQIPPNVRSGDFLSRIYRARRVKPYFDGVALHPYVARAAAMRSEILNLRRVMGVHRDAATPLDVTELGWGSDSFESRWERGPLGQARELNRAFEMLTEHQLGWRIGGVWWFSWTDQAGACQFCDSAGLLTSAHEAKPAWYSFNEWTGGDAGTVPRAAFLP
jgi:polysaccharide biosynthesis protein PslG